VTVAEDFTVKYYDTYKVVTNERANETYALYQCGTTPPAESDLPPGAKVLEIPLSSVAVDDTTALGFLRYLGVEDRVAYGSSWAVAPCMQRLAAPASDGGCGAEAADSGNATAVKAQAPRVDATFGFAADANNSESVAFTATRDPGAVRRAEWIKFVAPFFNKEVEANRLFKGVSDAYDATKAAAAEQLAASSASGSAARPKVAWLSKSNVTKAWGYEFDGPAYGVFFTPYKAQLLADAGAQNVAASNASVIARYPAVASADPAGNGNVLLRADTPANKAAAGAALRALLKDADVVIDETFYADPDTGKNLDAPTLAMFRREFGLEAPEDDDLKFLQGEGRVYTLGGTQGKSGGSDWFETAVVRPDLVLEELAAAFNPGFVPAGAGANSTNSTAASGESTWLYRLGDGSAKPRKLTPTQCDSKAACGAAPQAICPTAYRTCPGQEEAAGAKGGGGGGAWAHSDPSDRCAAPPPCAAALDEGLAAAGAKSSAGAASASASAVAVVVSAVAAAVLAVAA
jgi:hypothetical protein